MSVRLRQMAEDSPATRSVLWVLTSDRVHRLGDFLFRVFFAGTLGMLWTLQTISAVVSEVGTNRLVGVVCGVAGLAAIVLILFPHRRLIALVVAVAVLSLVINVLTTVLGLDFEPVLAEVGALLLLLTWTVRRFGQPVAKLASGLVIAALLMQPLRLWGDRVVIAYEFLIVMGIVAAGAIGAYLYSVDAKRRRAISTVRQGERLELARELHDFVAHHVTGIVVQAQAAQYIPHDDPQKARESFSAIEKAGLEALTSMRRLVEVMRQEDSGTGSRPLGDLAQTAELVERFQHGDAIATLYVSAELTPDTLAPEVAASVHRIVQEGLTNVRKHATGVSAVTVSISAGNQGVEVAVRDDGRGIADSRLSSAGGGYGLEGLHERATAIGGRLTGGPRPEGGWEVVAVLPTAK